MDSDSTRRRHRSRGLTNARFRSSSQYFVDRLFGRHLRRVEPEANVGRLIFEGGAERLDVPVAVAGLVAHSFALGHHVGTGVKYDDVERRDLETTDDVG